MPAHKRSSRKGGLYWRQEGKEQRWDRTFSDTPKKKILPFPSNSHFPSASPCQAPYSDMEMYQAKTTGGQQTPHSFLLRTELLSLSLCHESVGDREVSSAVRVRASSERRLHELDGPSEGIGVGQVDKTAW